MISSTDSPRMSSDCSQGPYIWDLQLAWSLSCIMYTASISWVMASLVFNESAKVPHGVQEVVDEAFSADVGW